MKARSSITLLASAALFMFLSSAAPPAASRDWYFAASSPASAPASGAKSRALAGTTPENPLIGLEELNRSIERAETGDRFLLKRGDVFTGTLVCGARSAEKAPLRIGAYGAGSPPVITDLAKLSAWKRAGPSLWSCKAPGFSGTKPSMLLRDGQALALGRYPNADAPWGGYLAITGHEGKKSIASSALPEKTDWTGAEAVVRSRRWILDRVPVEGVTKSALILSSELSYEPFEGFGFFLQDHPACLDREGEWRFDQGTGEIFLFSAADPAKRRYEVPTMDLVADFSRCAFIAVTGVEFRGGRARTVLVDDSVSLGFEACAFTHSGGIAVSGSNSTDFRFAMNSISDAQNGALKLASAWNLIVAGNKVERTALAAGMGWGSDGAYLAFDLSGNDVLIEGNTILRTGYIPLIFNGDRVKVRENLIDGFALVKDDAGGIYTWSDGSSERVDRVVERNVVRNGVGAKAGQPWSEGQSNGIYMGDRTGNVRISGNVVSACSGAGVYVHNAHDILIEGNTLFGNEVQISASRDDIAPDFPIRDCLARGNVLFSEKADQLLVYLTNWFAPDLPDMAFSGNSYSQPLRTEGGMKVWLKDKAAYGISPSAWTAPTGQDPTGILGTPSIESFEVKKLSEKELASPGAWPFPEWGYWAGAGMAQVEVSGGTAKFRFDAPSTLRNSNLLFYSPSFKVEAGKKYLLTFKARASRPGTSLGFLFRKNGDPYNQVCAEVNLSLGTGLAEHRLLLTADADEAFCRAEFFAREDDFARGGKLEETWIEVSGVELREAAVVDRDPALYCRFLSNPSGKPVELPVAGPWFDAWGKPVAGKIKLGPWSAVCLGKGK